MQRMSVLGMTLAALAILPVVAVAQKTPAERERVHTTVTTPIDATWAGCTEAVRVVGTLETTTRAGESRSGQVHSVIHTRLRDATAVGVTTGTEYKVQSLDASHRSYEFGGADRYTAGSQLHARVMGPGSGNDFVVTLRWRYRQDQAGNIVVNEIQAESGCKPS